MFIFRHDFAFHPLDNDLITESIRFPAFRDSMYSLHVLSSEYAASRLFTIHFASMSFSIIVLRDSIFKPFQCLSSIKKTLFSPSAGDQGEKNVVDFRFSVFGGVQGGNWGEISAGCSLAADRVGNISDSFALARCCSVGGLGECEFLRRASGCGRVVSRIVCQRCRFDAVRRL